MTSFELAVICPVIQVCGLQKTPKVRRWTWDDSCSLHPYYGNYLSLYPYPLLKEPFKGNLGFTRGPAQTPGGSRSPAWKRLRLLREALQRVPGGDGRGGAEGGGLRVWAGPLGNPRFPLKGSFKGDMDIDMDIDSYHSMDI